MNAPKGLRGFTQMTGFFHELEHGAVHDQGNARAIDSDYVADAKKINANCAPKQVETQSAPLLGTLVPPS